MTVEVIPTGLPSDTPAVVSPEAPPVLGTPEYDAAMILKYENSQNPPVTPEAVPAPTVAKPEHVPEKFWDAAKGEANYEAMAKAYAELESKLGGKPPAEVVPPVPPTEPETAKAELATKGLDYDALAASFATNGSLTEADYKSLEAVGIPKALADSFVAGQVALAESTRTKGFELAGGEESYTQMVEWAKSALSPSEIDAYNNAVSGTPAQLELAILGLQAKYKSEVGTQPRLFSGSTQAAQTGGYQSKAEMTADMRNPQYGKDPAYRAQVQAKLAATQSF